MAWFEPNGIEFTTSQQQFLSSLAGLSYSTGDLLYYDGLNLARRGIGSTGQVLTVSGGLPTWQTMNLSSFSTSNLLEGSNLYFTDERAQDAVGAMIDSSLVYVDGTPLLTRATLIGDVTASQGSNTLTIANDSVTYAKMQNVSTNNVVLGRITAGAGDVEELTAANIATISDTVTPIGHVIHVQHSANQTLTTSVQTYIKHDTLTFSKNASGFYYHFTSDANLTGTVAKTATSTALVGTGTSFTTELSVGQCIIVPGTANEYRIVASITDNTNLVVYGAFANTANGQTAARTSTAIGIAKAGLYIASASAYWNNDTTGNRSIAIFKNNGEFGLDEVTSISGNCAGVSYGAIKTNTAPAATNTVVVTPPIPMDVGDFFQQECYHNAGSDRAVIDYNSGSPHLSVRFVGYE